MTSIDKTGWVFGDPTTGMIARIVPDKGFAFVRSGDRDYFLHHSDFDGEFLSLREKMIVTFVPTDTPKGPRATQAERNR